MTSPVLRVAGLLLGLALLVLPPGIGAAHAADAVLLASTAPGYTPGMAIAATDSLVLPDGASITVLFRSGQMLHLRGPFEGSLDRAQPADKGSASGLATLLRLQGTDASVIGGTRSTGGFDAASLARDVAVEPMHSATYCVGPADTVWIHRPAVAGTSYGLRRGSGVRAIVFPAGADRIAWPDDVSIEDSDRFDLVIDGKAYAAIDFHLLASRYPSPAAWIAAGSLAGCHGQFDRELRQLSQESVPPELWLTSSHGRTPVYRSGEAIGLTVQADSDGFLYCVVQRDDGSAVPLFPAGALDGPRVRGAVPVSIPGERRRNPVLAGPPGIARVACWLADHDISPELPHALLDPVAGRLPERLAADLDSVFAGVGGGALPKAVLTIRVE